MQCIVNIPISVIHQQLIIEIKHELGKYRNKLNETDKEDLLNQGYPVTPIKQVKLARAAFVKVTLNKKHVKMEILLYCDHDASNHPEIRRRKWNREL